MCSIIAYLGSKTAAPVLVNGLRRMEYRGYDSVGLATFSKKRILVKKGVGKVEEVNRSLALEKMNGFVGIGHTRWATHGGVTDKNAHPHKNCHNDIAIVHNGIIDNYDHLRKQLEKKGHKFRSETDSEVIAHLLGESLTKNKDLRKAMLDVTRKLKGAYAFVAVFDDGKLAGARYDEPLIVGIAKDGSYVSSDVLGFIEHTDQAVFLDNNEIVILDEQGPSFYNSKGKVKKRVTQVAWELVDADKGRFAHYTVKEINEQKHTIVRNLSVKRSDLQKFVRLIRSSKNLVITGSGSSYHAAMVAKQLFAKYGKIPCEAVLSSEFPSDYGLGRGSVIMALSQSGETADLLQAIKTARLSKVKPRLLSLVNVTTSSLARVSDAFLGLSCGPEIGVAATKSFTAQLSLIYRIADELSNSKIHLDEREISRAVGTVLNDAKRISALAEKIKHINNIYVLGRGLHFPIALETALKLKELVYVHAEGIPAGELKHGPLALMDEHTVIIMLNPKDDTYKDTLSSVHEIKARGAAVVGVSDVHSSAYDEWIKIPKVSPFLYPIIEVIPLQLLAYYTALKRESNPDYPRNLAKSVTVK